MKFTVVLPGNIRKKNELRRNVLQIAERRYVIDIMKDLLQERFAIIFNDDGTSKGFAICFYNDEFLDNLYGKEINDGDELEIITAKSGG